VPKPFTPAQIRHVVEQVGQRRAMRGRVVEQVGQRRAMRGRVVELESTLAVEVPELDLATEGAWRAAAPSPIGRAGRARIDR
jgi:hypothetical protein